VELVERGIYLAALGEQLSAAAAGHGRLVVVGAEAGGGKTALLRRFVDEHAHEARILWGACDGLFTPQPLGLLYDLAPELGLNLESPRREVFAATLDALRPGPTVAVLEDVHWADEASLDLLRFLARRLDSTATLLIATYRDDELASTHPLRAVLGTVESRRRISLPSLSEQAVRGLAGESSVDPGELYRLTGGNPFFVTEVLAAGSNRVPASVRDAVLARVARMGEAARAALDTAAVVGAQVEVELLGDLLEEPGGALEECIAAGALQAHGTVVGFRHELSRRTIEEALEPLRRSQLHRRVLAVLVARKSDPARLAYHAEAAGDAAAVLEYAPAAAERATELGAHREAAAQYGRALRFSDGLPAREVAGLLEMLAHEGALIEEIEPAERAAAAALELYRGLDDTRKQGEVLVRLSTLAYLRAENDESEDRAAEAIELLEPLGASRELALAYSARARGFHLALDVREAAAWADRARSLAEELGEDEIAAHAAFTTAAAGELGDAPLTATEELLGLALERGWDDRAVRAYGHLVFRSVRRRDWPAADRWLEEGLHFARERDLDGHVAYLLSWRARGALDRERWDRVEADLAEALATSHAPLSLIWILSVLSLLRARRGDPGVWEAADEAWTVGQRSTGSEQRMLGLRNMRAESALLEGDAARALAELGDLPIAELADRWAAGENAIWRARSGAHVAETGELPEPWARELAGDHAGAAAAWEERDVPYEAGWALAGSDDEEDLRRSLEIFQSLGARPAAAIVARRLRERGARGVARGPRTATKANPAGLTRRELEVLALLTEGLRDSEIAAKLVISEKTVGHHVSAILRKLGVRSRYDAARAAEELLVER
jgi:DNA-binding CsgD family transcriptional regulator